jgi:hypothetical protein
MKTLAATLTALARKTTLTPAEKADGRRLLQAALALSADDPSLPLSEHEHEAIRSRLKQKYAVAWVPLGARLKSAFGLPAVALGLILSTGLAAAANDALPGDTLYPLKISVIEPVIGALQPTEHLRAAWSVEVLNRRLHEIERLNAPSRLESTNDTSARLHSATELLRHQGEKVVRITEDLSSSERRHVRDEAADALDDSSLKIRSTLEENESETDRARPLQELLTTLDGTKRAFQEDDESDDSSSQSSSSSRHENRSSDPKHREDTQSKGRDDRPDSQEDDDSPPSGPSSTLPVGSSAFSASSAFSRSSSSHQDDEDERGEDDDQEDSGRHDSDTDRETQVPPLPF